MDVHIDNWRISAQPEAGDSASWPNSLNWQDAFHGDSPVTDSQIQEITKRLEACLSALKDVDPSLCKLAGNIMGQLGKPHTTIVFGGRWKVGKSLLVNRLVGRNILPENIEAETGAPCFISAGTEDKVVVARDGKEMEIIGDKESGDTYLTEVLRKHISLWKRTLQTSEQELAGWVDITLKDCAVPATVCWADTPGLDESSDMHLVTSETFRTCDLLVWIAKGGGTDLISMTDWTFVKSHVEQAGGLGVVFLTNVIIPDSRQYDEGWDQFLTDQMPTLRNRFVENMAAMGLSERCPPRMLSVCARAIGSDVNSKYGAAEVNKWIRSITSPKHAMVRSARLNRAAVAFADIAKSLGEREKLVQSDNIRIAAEIEAKKEILAKRRARFERVCESYVESFISQFRVATLRVAGAVSGEINVTNLKRDNTYYGQLLGIQLRSIVEPLCKQFENSVREAVLEYEQGNRKIPPIVTTIDFGDVKVDVPHIQGNLGSSIPILIMIILFCFGPVGWIILGIIIFKQKNDQKKAIAQDIIQTKQNIMSEGKRISDESEKIISQLKRFAHDSFSPGYESLATPDMTMQNSLIELKTEFESLQNLAMELAELTS